MKPIEFDEANSVFTAPEGISKEECGDLPVFVGENQEKKPVVVSCWMPSKEELEQLNAGRPILMVVYGHSMPMISLFMTNENGDVLE